MVKRVVAANLNDKLQEYVGGQVIDRELHLLRRVCQGKIKKVSYNGTDIDIECEWLAESRIRDKRWKRCKNLFFGLTLEYKDYEELSNGKIAFVNYVVGEELEFLPPDHPECIKEDQIKN